MYKNRNQKQKDMHTIKNFSKKYLDSNLAVKMIRTFLAYANEGNPDILEVDEIEPIPTESLLEERFIIRFCKTRKTCNVVFGCGIQESKNNGIGNPDYFYHGVREINFESTNKALVEKMQTSFEEYLQNWSMKGKELPEDLVKAISLRVK